MVEWMPSAPITRSPDQRVPSDQPAVEGVDHQLVVKCGSRTARSVDIIQLSDVVGEIAKPWQQAHGLGGVEAGSEEVDHVPFAAETVCPFNQMHVPGHAIQQAGEGQAGDAGAADQGTHGQDDKDAEAAALDHIAS
jgi:hypothetical protein